MFSLLYVDDEQGLLDLGQLFLESDGEFRVTTAISAEAGLRALAEQDFDAVVSDYQMPEMNGIEFLKRVRKNYGNIPFILFTGRGREEVVIEAINNGVDFYLQKGGDPKSQFAELAHKVRQAVTRRRAEAALSESEKRLADIINFLPDATFAIDKDGRVIAWNHAIEEMTGIAATEMLGKGNHEYALPFYNTRRPILIDLIFEPEEVIAKNYANITRNKDLLSADTTLPRPKGREVTLMGVAGPLYDRSGQLIGAIESIRDITERKRAEESLNESERRFRELADLLPQGIYETDTRGRMTYVNRIALEMSGYTPEDILTGMNALDVIAPVDRKRAAAVFSRMVETGIRDQGSAEYLAVRKDGGLFPVSIYSSPINRDGKITGTRGVILDIADQKKTEERLLSANREYTSLLDQIQDIYYFADTAGKLVRASRSLATLLGYDDIAECIGRSIADDFYYNPADRQRLLDELNRNGKVTGFEVLLKRKDGAPVLVEVSSHLSRDQEGHVNGVEGTFHDITARKKAEDDLRAAYELLAANEEELKEQYNELVESEKRIRESEQKYRTVFETTGTAMLMIEEDTTISLVNDEFSRLSGYPREEIENKKRWMEFVVPQDRDRMLAQHRRRRSDPGIALTQYEFRFMTRTGEIRDILLSIDIIPGTRKSVASLLDITERKKAADEIQAVNEQLVASDEELRAQYDELAYSEKLIRMSEARLQFMLGFYEYSKKSEKELLEYAIEGAGIVTGSTLGYLAFLNDDETELSMYAWSKNAMAECSMITKPIIYQVEKTGLWGEAVRQRRPVITNDYAAPDPAKKGYPEGHPHIIRHMNVPVIDNGHIVLVAGVANRPGDYTEHDVNELLLLMQGLWEILRRRRVQEAKNAADEMLRKSEEELRLLKISTDRSSDQIFWLDFAGNILYVNDAAVRDYGYSQEEFSRMKIFELNPDVNAEIWRRSVEDLRERKNQFITTRHRRRDGSIMDVEIVGVYVNQGDREYSFAYVRDITARTKTETDLKTAYEKVTAAEEELREQYDTLAAAEAEISARRTQLEEIAATVPGVVYQFYARPDGSRGMYFASTRAREVFGLEPDLEKFFPEFAAHVHAEDQDGFLASIDRAVSQRTDWHFEGRFTKESGETIWFEGRSTPVLRGSELVFSGVLLDITERKQMEEALRASEAKYRLLVENIPFGITLIDADHRIIMSNTAQGQMFHTDPELWVGRDCFREFEKRDAVCAHCPGTRAMATGTCHVVETEGVRDDGTRFSARVHAIPLPDAEGKATRFIEVVEDITERKIAEDALRQNEEKYRTLIETTGTGFVIIDQDGRVLDANPEYVRLTGHSCLEDITGRSVTEWTAGYEREKNAEAVRQCMQNGFIRNFEVDYAHRDGTIIPIEINATVLHAKGSVQILTLCRDITERKQAEAALRQANLVVENSPVVLFRWVAREGWPVAFVSRNVSQFGYTPEELMSGTVPYASIVHPDDLEQVAREVQKYSSEGPDEYQQEYRIITRDGNIRWIDDRTVIERDEDGKITHYQGIIIDITERKRAEDALIKTGNFTRALLDAIPTPVFYKDREGRYLGCNRAFTDIMGVSSEQLAGKTVFELWPSELSETYHRKDLELMENPQHQIYEFSVRDREGKIRPVIYAKDVFFDEAGQVAGIVGAFLDISGMKQAEQALRESESTLSSIFRAAPTGIGLVVNRVIMKVNDLLCEMTGYSPEELLGKNARILYPSDEDYEFVGREKYEQIRKHGTGTVETRWQRKDGRVIDVLLSSTPLDPADQGKGVTFTALDITTRKTMETALRESEAKFRGIIDQSFEFVGLMTTDGILIDVNRTALQLVGTTGTEVLNRPFWDTPWWSHSKELQEKLKDAIRRAATGETVRFEATHPAADGHLAYIDFSVKPAVDSDGTIRYLIPEGRDITGRKRVEDELMRLKISTDRSSDEIFWLDFAGNILYANDAACRITGYSHEEFSKMKIFELDPDFPPEVWDASVADLREKKTQFITTRHRCRDGTIINVEIVSVYVNQDDREYSFAYVRDITGRRQMENALRESEEKYRTLVESSFDGIAIHQDGRMVYVNQTAARLLGYDDPGQIIGIPAIDIVAPAFRGMIARRIQESSEKPMELLREQFLRFDGTSIDVDVTTIPTSWEGRPATYVTFRDITAQVRAEEGLRENEEKYRTLVEVNRDIIYSLGTDGTILYISPQTETQLGYRPDEMIGQNFSNYIHPDDLGTLLNHIQEHAGTGTDIQADRFRVRRNDGAYRWYEDKSIYTSDHRGGWIVAGTIRDITDEKAAQDALRESEEKFRALVETTSDFIWEVDAAGKYTYVSPQVRRILGYAPEELTGKTPFDLMPPEEASGIAAEFNRCVLGRLPITALENKALTKDGSVVILETSGVVRTAEDGSFQGYRGIDRDITERKQTEEALRKKTEEFNQFFTANLDLFCIADTDGYFRRLNPQWERTLGYSLAELEGHRFLDFVHPDDLKQTLAAVSLLGTQKAVHNFTNRYRHRDGTYRWIEWRALPIGNTIFAAARDITDRYFAAERTTRISALKQDLLRTAPLEEKLKQITDGIVHIFGADFARIWITGTGDLCERGCIHAVKTTGSGACRDRTRCLHLVISSGRYTHIDGGHRRVPFGAYKIGRLATGQDEQFITNDVTHDPRVHDHAWAASLGLVSFAGFRLVSAEGTPVGVLAFFSRMPVLPEMMEDLADLATTASQVIQTGMTELALRESEARLGSILHGSPVLQFVIDRSHRVISWNRALEEYSGIRAADIIGTDLQWRAFYAKKRPVLADLLVDQDIEEIDTWYAGKFTKSHDIEGAYTATDFFPHMGGSGKWLSFTAAPVRDEKGTIIGAVETLEDITERVNAENALRQSEEWARTILNTAQTGIVIVDADTHRILEANKKALDLIGLPAESVIGSVCHRFICPAEEGKCPVTDCGMTVDTSERILIAANGSHILVLKTVIPVTMGSRNFLVESFVDISEQKRSESAIREANRKLNLLSSITRHDLVNQLTVLHGYTQLAAMKEPDPVVKDFLGKIETAVETMQRQIQFTKEYQELGVHAPAWFNIGEVIRGARPKKVRLQCSCDDFEVFADPLIGRVFYNLFDNAMKYGGHVTTITAGCKKQGDELLVTFADNGVGIPLDEKKKIFDKGYGKNTGFGLFLAREILAITGITIHETGMEGKGARFEIVVPKGAFREKT